MCWCVQHTTNEMRMMNRGCLLEAKRRMLVVSMHNALIAKSHENASRCIYTKCIIEREKNNNNKNNGNGDECKTHTKKKNNKPKQNRAREPKLRALQVREVPKMAKSASRRTRKIASAENK